MQKVMLTIAAALLALCAVNFPLELTSSVPNENIVITVATKSKFKNITIANSADVGDVEMAGIISWFEFDIDNSGSTKVANDVSPYFPDVLSLKEHPWQENDVDGVIFLSGDKNSQGFITISFFDTKSMTTIDERSFALDSIRKKDCHDFCDGVVSYFGGVGIANTKILYLKTKDDNSSEVWSIDYDGCNDKKIFANGSLLVNIRSAQEKFPGYFLCSSYHLGQPKIFLGSIKRGKVSRIIPLRGNQIMAAISLQGDRMAFVSDVGGNPDIFLQRISKDFQAVGKPVQLVSFPRSTQGSPVFSPEGNRLAFVSNKDGYPRIYVIDIDEWKNKKNRKLTVISKKNLENTSPAWSWNGRKIAYSSKINGCRQICVYDFDSDDESVVTTGSDNKENPVWMKNDLCIIYNSVDISKNCRGNLFVVNILDSSQRKVSDSYGWNPSVH